LRFASPKGAAFRGRLDSVELHPELTSATRGLFCKSSTSAATAAFAELAGAGLPVVAADVPEFSYLGLDGVGIVADPRTSKEILNAEERVTYDHEAWERRLTNQLTYAQSHSWRMLVGRRGAPLEHAQR
jgi:glycosyltransferase involved in cell wall biosynthesis